VVRRWWSQWAQSETEAGLVASLWMLGLVGYGVFVADIWTLLAALVGLLR
jgi:hypothetical protein